MNPWDWTPYCNYPTSVFPRPVRNVIRFVILTNLAILCSGAVLFGIVGSFRVIREVTAHPERFQTRTARVPQHHTSRKDRASNGLSHPASH